MPIELTTADYSRIHAATKSVQKLFNKPEGIAEIAIANYRAALVAGIELSYDTVRQLNPLATADECAAAIKALIK